MASHITARRPNRSNRRKKLLDLAAETDGSTGVVADSGIAGELEASCSMDFRKLAGIGSKRHKSQWDIILLLICSLTYCQSLAVQQVLLWLPLRSL